MVDTAMQLVASGLLFLGLALATVGLYGLLRRPDIFHQLHAAGLVTGPAVILVLLAALSTGNAEIATSAILVIAFVLITSPLSGHAVARAALHRMVEERASAASDTARGDNTNAQPGGR
jgi:monovalent cation/proton antiporter MnhG/PhaG subunit